MDVNQEDPPEEIIEEIPAVRRTPGKILEAPGRKSNGFGVETVIKHSTG